MPAPTYLSGLTNVLEIVITIFFGLPIDTDKHVDNASPFSNKLS